MSKKISPEELLFLRSLEAEQGHSNPPLPSDKKGRKSKYDFDILKHHIPWEKRDRDTSTFIKRQVFTGITLARCNRLKEYAEAGTISEELLGHPNERQLWREYTAYKKAGFKPEYKEDLLLETLLEEAGFRKPTKK